MQSHAAPGEIMVTVSTFQRLRDGFLFDRPRLVEVKGKGQLATYRLRGRRSTPLPGSSPASVVGSGARSAVDEIAVTTPSTSERST
jgi:hypothetical protein